MRPDHLLVSLCLPPAIGWVVAWLAGCSTPTLHGEDRGPAASPDEAGRFPSVKDLPAQRGLPDPFVGRDGTRVESASEWTRHRPWLRALLEHYEYGRMPPHAGAVDAEVLWRRELLGGTAIEQRVVLSCGPERAIRIRASLTVPRGDGPFPVVFKNESRLGPHCPILARWIERGYAFAEYVVTDLDPDARDQVGPAQAAYPDHDWATIAVWAWGGMRLVDYLSSLPFVDRDRLVCTGHSRGGKTALLTAAFDERIAVVAPNGSGAGGAGSYRIRGEKSESLDAITNPDRFGYWFHRRLRDFAGREERLPFDQHFLASLVAPRALLITGASGDLWANPLGTQQVYLAAKEVYSFLGARPKIGIHVRAGQHDQLVADWLALLDFAELHLFGRRPPPARWFDRVPFHSEEPAFEWRAPRPRLDSKRFESVPRRLGRRDVGGARRIRDSVGPR